MHPKEDPKTSVVLYMRIDPFKILTESRLVVVAELLLSIVQLFGVTNPGSTYGWVSLNDGDMRWLALFELPQGYEEWPLTPDDIELDLPKGTVPRPHNGLSEDDLS